MNQILAYDRNGDAVTSETPLHGKGSKTPSNRIRQDERHEDCVMVTDLNGKDDQTFFHANGFGQVPRIRKDTFKDSYWQVKPY